jgi:hypothetical protein
MNVAKVHLAIRDAALRFRRHSGYKKNIITAQVAEEFKKWAKWVMP